MSQQPPLGYANRIKARTKQEAVGIYARENIQTIVKLRIEEYIRSFTDLNGANRSSVEALPSIQSIVTDQSFSPDSDPTKFKVTLERYTERLKAQLPSITIADTGLALKTSGLGRSTSQSRHSQTLIANMISIVREVGIMILVASNSQATTNTLAQVLHAIFYDLPRLLNGGILQPTNQTDTWSIRLPLTVDAGNTEKNQQGDDPQVMVWTNTINFTVTFEDSYIVRGDDIIPNFSTSEFDDPKIDAPATVKLGTKKSMYARNLRVTQRVVVQNPNLIRLSHGTQNNEYIIHALNPGTTEIRIVDRNENNNGPDMIGKGSSIQPKLVSKHTIEVVF